MACNAPTCGYPDWSFTAFTLTPTWRACRYRKFSQRSGTHPYSRKNRLYFAFRELGRVIRTIFLLNYLSSLELRHLIQAATNKSELFNKYAQWAAFGESGLVTEGVRDEQRKLIKYNHLVANLLIFHTIVGMTRVVEQMTAEGLPLNEAALANLSPYQTEHINRFGNYTLDFARVPLPLPTESTIRMPVVPGSAPIAQPAEEPPAPAEQGDLPNDV